MSDEIIEVVGGVGDLEDGQYVDGLLLSARKMLFIMLLLCITFRLSCTIFRRHH